ncbi:MAG: hypothetical protein WCJ62_09880, partial [Flavobacterium sp.]
LSVDPSANVFRHQGQTPLILCFMLPGGEIAFADTHDLFKVQPSEELVKELEEVLGKETVYLKADTTMPKPENPRERFKKRNSDE